MVRREIAFLRSSPWDLFGMFGWPAIIISVLLLTFASGTARHLPIAVVDEDHSNLSRGLIRDLDADEALRVAALPNGPTQAMSLVRRSKIEGFVVIPARTQRAVSLGRQAHLQVYVNALHALSAGLIDSQFQTLTLGGTVTLQVIARAKHLTPAQEGTAESLQIVPDVRSLYNPRNNYEGYLADNLIPAVIVLTLALGVVSAFSRELRKGTVPAWLAAAQNSPVRAIAGKALPYWLVSSTYLCAGTLIVAGQLGYRHGIAIVLLASLLAAAVYTAVGVAFVGLVANNFPVGTSATLASVYISPSFSFSGVTFPQFNTFAYWWSNASPLTPFLRLRIAQLQIEAPIAASVADLAHLGLFFIVLSAIVLLTFPALMRTPARWGEIE